MVSDEFVAAAKEWYDKLPTYLDFFKSLPKEKRIQAITLFCLHKNCDMRTIEMLFRYYDGELDYLFTEKAMPVLPSREAYFESVRQERLAKDTLTPINLYQCPKCSGPVRKLYTTMLPGNPPQYIYRCYDCGLEEVNF